MVRQFEICAFLLTWCFGVLIVLNGMEPPIHLPTISIASDGMATQTITEVAIGSFESL